jgi:hypothetical protein
MSGEPAFRPETAGKRTEATWLVSAIAFAFVAAETTVSSASATAATRSPAAATAATAAASEFINLRTCLAGRDVFTAEVFIIHSLDCLERFFLRGHYNKAKPPRFSAEFVFNDARRFDLAERFKRLAQLILTYGTGQISYIDIHIFPFYT